MQKIISLFGLFVIICTTAAAQEKKDSLQPKIIFKGLFQAQYIFSLQKNVDVNGLQHTDGKGVYNTFDVHRARVQFAAAISDRTDVAFNLNLADFKGDPKNKVLENAYLTYRLNSYIHIKVGQFRPAFGLENTYPIDIIKSFDYSNQYNAFGNNGWESFQVGLSVFGDLKTAIPVRYELTVLNGNGKNQPTDDDNGKQACLRFDLSPSKNFKLGINGGYGKHNGENVYAEGLDASLTVPLQKKLSLETEAECKQGNDQFLYFNTLPAMRTGGIDKYMMRGFYILPDLRYAIAYHRLSSIELSCRYEYFDEDFKNANNPRQTLTPMISLEFLKAYNARIQIGVVADIYRKNIPATTQYTGQLFILQVQTRL